MTTGRDRIALPRMLARGALALTGLLALLAISTAEGSFGRVRGQVLLLTVGLYFGRRTARTAAPFTGMPSPMAHLPADEVRRRTGEDLGRLRTVTAGLLSLQRKMADDHEQVRQRMAAEDRSYFLPAEDDRLRWHFVTYLSYRSALRRLVATYSGFQAVREPALRGRCFMLGHAAGHRDRPQVRRRARPGGPRVGLRPLPRRRPQGRLVEAGRRSRLLPIRRPPAELQRMRPARRVPQKGRPAPRRIP